MADMSNSTGQAMKRMAIGIVALVVLTALLYFVAPDSFYPWAKAIHLSPSSPGWPACSICRGCSSITPMPRKVLSSPRPSR